MIRPSFLGHNPRSDIEMIDLRFTDVPGLWQHFSVPPRALGHDNIVDGVGFDGSSIRGFQEIQESDMLVIPDPVPVYRSADPGSNLQYPRSGDGPELQP